MQLVNPKIKLVYRLNGVEHTIEDAEMSFRVDKDLTEEPNDAEFIIYNLNSSNRDLLYEAGQNESPISFYATTIEDPGGAYKLGFAGEMDQIINENMNPGYESRIFCTSQKRNHREFWFQKTYAAGTYEDDIINDLLAEINLPKGNTWEQSTNTVILSKTFAGPAYELLQRFMFDLGMYCYIRDGKIYSSLVDVAPDGLVKSMNDYVLRGNPMQVTRTARNRIEMKTVIEVTGRIPDLFKSGRRRRKRRKKDVETYGQNDYVNFEAVDQDIPGLDFPLFLQPDINPDDMVSYGGVLYRAISLEHVGDNFGGEWDTNLTTDIYEDTGGDFI